MRYRQALAAILLPTTATVLLTTRITVEAACDVKLQIDGTVDFAPPGTSITFDSFRSNGIAEGANTPLNRDASRLRITNTSGGTAAYGVVGVTRQVT